MAHDDCSGIPKYVQESGAMKAVEWEYVFACFVREVVLPWIGHAHELWTVPSLCYNVPRRSLGIIYH